MRILHIDTGREMRGGQWQVLHLMQGLAERSIGARLLARKGCPLFQAASSLSLDVRPLAVPFIRWEARGFELVHAHDARAHTLGLFCGKPLIVARRVGFRVKENLFSEWKYGRPKHFFAVSAFVKQTLVEVGVPADRITVVYDGVRLPEQVSNANRTLVLALDSTDPAKGKSVVEQAARLASVPVHFSQRLLRDLPVSLMFVYVTALEGLGSAALLAMAYGAPVIASRVGGLPEIVEDGITGVLTDNAPESIANAMRRLYDDRDLLTRMGTRARKQVERHFTVEHMVGNTIKAYERVLA